MKQSGWRILPLLVVVLCVLIAHGLALDVPHHLESQIPLQDGHRHRDSARWEDVATADGGDEQDKSDEQRHAGV